MISNEENDEDGNNKHCDESEVGVVVVFMMPSPGKNEKKHHKNCECGPSPSLTVSY